MNHPEAYKGGSAATQENPSLDICGGVRVSSTLNGDAAEMEANIVHIAKPGL
jgi:hypothetical protein